MVVQSLNFGVCKEDCTRTYSPTVVPVRGGVGGLPLDRTPSGPQERRGGRRWQWERGGRRSVLEEKRHGEHFLQSNLPPGWIYWVSVEGQTSEVMETFLGQKFSPVSVSLEPPILYLYGENPLSGGLGDAKSNNLKIFLKIEKGRKTVE